MLTVIVISDTSKASDNQPLQKRGELWTYCVCWELVIDICVDKMLKVVVLLFVHSVV